MKFQKLDLRTVERVAAYFIPFSSNSYRTRSRGLALVADGVLFTARTADCSGFAPPWPSLLAIRAGVRTIVSLRTWPRIIPSRTGCTIKDRPMVVYYSRHRVFTWHGDRRRYHNSLSYRRSTSKSARLAGLRLAAIAIPIPPAVL